MPGVTGLTFGFEMAQARLQGIAGAFDRACEEFVQDGCLIIEGATKKNLQDGREEWPDLSESTIAGSDRGPRDHMLNVTGHMMRGVTHVIRKGGKSTVGYIGWSTGGEYAPAQEFGSTRAGKSRRVKIPARPHMRPAVEENEERLNRAFEKRVREAVK